MGPARWSHRWSQPLQRLVRRIPIRPHSLQRSDYQVRIQGGGRWGWRPPLGRKDSRRSRRRGFPRLKGRKKGHWCLLNGCSTPSRHNMAINILKSCKSVFAYVKNRSFPSHIGSSFPWRPPLAEILDPRLIMAGFENFSRSGIVQSIGRSMWQWRPVKNKRRQPPVYGIIRTKIPRLRSQSWAVGCLVCKELPEYRRLRDQNKFSELSER